VRVARSTRFNELEVEGTADLAARTPESLWVAGNRPASRAHTAFLTASSPGMATSILSARWRLAGATSLKAIYITNLNTTTRTYSDPSTYIYHQEQCASRLRALAAAPKTTTTTARWPTLCRGRGRQPPWPQQHQGQGFALVPQRGMATAPPPAASYAPQHTAYTYSVPDGTFEAPGKRPRTARYNEPAGRH